MTKLNKILDRWFGLCGFLAMSRITGTQFFDIDSIDESIAEAESVWDKLSVKEKLNAYRDLEFTDHLFFSQREFLVGYKDMGA